MTHRIWNPAAFQGVGVNRRYFEGWYFKHVDAAAQEAVAIIPGVSYSADGSASHSFVQVVPSFGAAQYHAYPIDAFTWDSTSPFSVAVGPNRFSSRGITLDLANDEHRVTGSVTYGPWNPWPVTTFSPGIMGWYRFVPAMECYHGVLSMDHPLSGSLTVDGHEVSLDGGRGYTEKDWGRSFPSSWIWAQSNTFERPATSVMLSVAKIPWMTGAFVGNIAGFLLDGELHRFATYTGAKVVCIETGENQAHVVLADRHERLEVRLHGCGTLVLKSPVLGAMEGKDAESLGGTIDVTLSRRTGGKWTTLFEGTGGQAGIEVMNGKDELGRIPCVEGDGE